MEGGGGRRRRAWILWYGAVASGSQLCGFAFYVATSCASPQGVPAPRGPSVELGAVAPAPPMGATAPMPPVEETPSYQLDPALIQLVGVLCLIGGCLGLVVYAILSIDE